MNGSEHFSGAHPATPDYHGALLGDPHRLIAYERALRQLIRPGDVVLDLGAGTGVLAMLAARLGAQVHAVESSPIAALAAQLIAHNGLGGQITLHHADLRALTPPTRVDLVVSDFMGRFLVDDGMLGLLDVARAWATPTTRWCPGEVRLTVAPVRAAVPPVQATSSSLLGLDLAPARAWALDHSYAAQLGADALLAAPQPYHALALPGPISPFDRELSFTLTQPGQLTGLAGWLDATLAPGVTLSAAPGVQTHWGQYLFPLPPVQVQAGDQLVLRLTLVPPATAPQWAWRGALWRDGIAIASFDQQTGASLRQSPVPVDAPLDRAGVQAANQAGCAAFAAGALVEACLQFERALRSAAPTDPALVRPLYENLGLARFNLGDDTGAILAFLRAIDDEPATRPQACRYLVVSLARAGRSIDAHTWLGRYQALFGPHPDFTG